VNPTADVVGEDFQDDGLHGRFLGGCSSSVALYGKLVVEHTNVLLRSTDFPNMQFNQLLLAPYFGPGLLPHAQKLWIDELAVGTRRIGPRDPSAAYPGGLSPVNCQ
jgi:hypothetical protein